MCRILSISGKDWQQSLVLEEFRRLAEYGHVPDPNDPGHKDGWGSVEYKDGAIYHYLRSLIPANEDKTFDDLLRSSKENIPDILISHFRKASVGGKKLVNTHPFVNGKISFCHNGWTDINIEVSGNSEELIQGETDSERFFYHIIERLEKGLSIRQAIRSSIENIREKHDFTAANILISDGRSVWGLREVNEENEKVKTRGLFDYYSLFLSTKKDSHIVCSEKLFLEGEWRPFENHELIEIDAKSGKVTSEII